MSLPTRLSVLLAAACFASSCTVEKHPTDLTVRVAAAEHQKEAVVAVLDQLTSEKGWVRTAAAPGLDELQNRKVIFFSYGRKPKEMLITITDLKTPAELELSAFFEPSAPGLVEGVVATFVARVKRIPGVSAVHEEPGNS
ncbi:MAG TPA: hypothetical protein VIR60_10875 [Gammaproteobacteria bacterium]